MPARAGRRTVTCCSFALSRKDAALIAAAAARLPRAAQQIVAALPEAHGIVVRNLAEDCSRH